VLVVPSVWEEPFGVVVLEALACGCVPLVTRSGGLPDAVGACGMVLPQGDRRTLAPLLAHGIDVLLGDPESLDYYRQQAAAHLERHTRDRVARDYLQVLTDACRSHATQSAARVV
jgi:glycosyltransferase involved in cell wall biosynthesis